MDQAPGTQNPQLKYLADDVQVVKIRCVDQLGFAELILNLNLVQLSDEFQGFI